MKEVYYLWEENNVPLFKKEYGQDIPNLTVYPIESDAAVPCVIVFPTIKRRNGIAGASCR